MTRPRHHRTARDMMELPNVKAALAAATMSMMEIIAYSGWMLSITKLATIFPICREDMQSGSGPAHSDHCQGSALPGCSS